MSDSVANREAFEKRTKFQRFSVQENTLTLSRNDVLRAITSYLEDKGVVVPNPGLMCVHNRDGGSMEIVIRFDRQLIEKGEEQNEAVS